MDAAVLLHLTSHRPLSLRAIEALTTVERGEVLAMATVAEVLTTVEHTPGCAGLLPVEDSYGGEDTAVLDRLTGDLCDAVTGGAAGRSMLEHPDRSNLFLVPLDDRRQWYRYHHLFADVLTL